jgi:hypothetical protein
VKHNFFASIWSFLTAVSILLSGHSYAQGFDDELLSISEEGGSKATSQLEAQREIQSKLISGVARDQVIEIIGEKRYQKNRTMVENRIVREAAKFIPFVQPGDIQKQPDGSWKMKVDLKLSVGSLRKMVIDTGLLSDADTPVTVVPMITFTDRMKAVSYRWWMGDSQDEVRKPLVEWASALENQLHRELMKQGFHLLLPLEGTVSNQLPQPFRVDRASSQDLKMIGDYLGISMVVRGDVRVKDSREIPGAWQIQLKLEVIPVQGGRTVAEISRTLETDSGPSAIVVKKKIEKEAGDLAKDLSTQVFEAWTRGTLAATTLKLAVKGNLTPKQLSEFRSQLLKSKSMRDIKAIRERLFEPGQVTYEVDYAASPEDFREKLKSLELSTFHEKFVQDAGADGLSTPFTLEVRPKGV